MGDEKSLESVHNLIKEFGGNVPNGNVDFAGDTPTVSSPKMLDYFRQHPEQIDWQSLSFNPDAIDLFANNLDKLDWEYVSEHPKAIELLIANPNKINWQTVWANPAIFTYDYKQMRTSKAELHRNLLEYLYFPLRDTNLL